MGPLRRQWQVADSDRRAKREPSETISNGNEKKRKERKRKGPGMATVEAREIAVGSARMPGLWPRNKRLNRVVATATSLQPRKRRHNAQIIQLPACIATRYQSW
jgi:hypothetical protein